MMRGMNSAEKSLWMQAINLELKYFRDLTMKDGRILNKLARLVHEDGTTESNDLQDAASLGIVGWRFRLRELGDHDGRCERKTKTIYIQRGHEGDSLKGIVLHEMIHAYEAQLWPSHRDWLLLWLYRRLCTKFGEKKVLRLIDLNTSFAIREPAHSGLFLLKSIELDCRLDWPLGTVFAYSRDSFFQERTSQQQG